MRYSKKIFLIILEAIIVVNIVAIKIDHPLVNTTVGLIRGRKADDGNYWKYQGIPYAKVNKSNPFGESLPYPRFKTTLEAYDDTAICPQVEEFNLTLTGSLDCLHLNIYVPEPSNKTDKFAVLVHIFGGNFTIGFAGTYLYGPKYLVRHDIIFVTFNYRLGPYGFLGTDISEISGNQGSKDQMKALRWIKKNIYAFGGDPNRITVSGHSFGANCLEMILHSMDENEKLFSKAILLSPSTCDLRNSIGTPDNSSLIDLGKYFNFSSSDLKNIYLDLARIDSKSVIEATKTLNISYFFCLENIYEGVQNFLVQNPLNSIIPAIKNMPILIGNVNNEFGTFYHGLTFEKLEERDIFQRAINFFNFDKVTAKELKSLIRSFYIENDTKLRKTSFRKIYNDFFFLHSARRKMLKYMDNYANPIYYYIFSYYGKRNFAKINTKSTEPGAGHADEIGYLFDMEFLGRNISKEDMLVINRLTTLWANFVKYGDPTPMPTKLLPVKWEPYTKEKQKYLVIDRDLTLKTEPLPQRMAFWDLFYSINGKYQNGYKNIESQT